VDGVTAREDLELSVQVAVIAVGVVESPPDGEVDVVAVGDRLVPAAGGVPVGALHRGAGAGAAPVHLEAMLVGVPFVRRVEMPVVQVVGVVAVADLAVAAAGPVPVLVVVVLAAGHRRTGGIVSPERGRRQSSPAALRSPAGVSS
jgi:hypothetical protein